MSNPGILYRIADNNRKLFIQNCIQFDAPRLEAAVYPEGLTVESDLPYAEGSMLRAAPTTRMLRSKSRATLFTTSTGSTMNSMIPRSLS